MNACHSGELVVTQEQQSQIGRCLFIQCRMPAPSIFWEGDWGPVWGVAGKGEAES